MVRANGPTGAWVVGVALALWAPATWAQDTWTTPYPGVRRLRRATSNQVINLLQVDLCAPGVSVRVTGASERARTVPSYGMLVGAQAAVNGGFYNTRDLSQTDGFVVHNGVAWGGTDHRYTGPVAFGAERVELIAHEVLQGPEGWMREAVSGHPTLVHDGQRRDNSGDTSLCPRNPRTAVGLSADRRTLYLAVVDGRSPPSRVGMTCNELAQMMQGFGARWALNLDGGGSSTMWLANAGVVNRPSDGTPRTVSNHLAVYARGTGASPHCPAPRFRAQYVMQTFPLARTTLDLPPGGTFRGYLEMRNTGTATWTPARTRLGTTQPRDRTSPVRGPDWLAGNRPAAVDRTVAPGATGRFVFTVVAPQRAGEYSEYFNLLEEGVAWFGDPGQGGPADNVIQVRVRTVAPSGMDAGVDAGRDAAAVDVVRDVAAEIGTPTDLGDDTAAGDAAVGEDAPRVDDTPTATDAPVADDAAVQDDAASAEDAGVPDDAAAVDDQGVPEEEAPGCACSAPGRPLPGAPARGVGLALLLALAGRLGRRHRTGGAGARAREE